MTTTATITVTEGGWPEEVEWALGNDDSLTPDIIPWTNRLGAPGSGDMSGNVYPIDIAPGKYKLWMRDTYGDGWNGATITYTSNYANNWLQTPPGELTDLWPAYVRSYEDTFVPDGPKISDGKDAVSVSFQVMDTTWTSRSSLLVTAAFGGALLDWRSWYVAVSDVAEDHRENKIAIRVGGGSSMSEGSWSIVDGNGVNIATGGAPHDQVHPIILPAPGALSAQVTWQLYMYDSGGDGWNGNKIAMYMLGEDNKFIWDGPSWGPPPSHTTSFSGAWAPGPFPIIIQNRQVVYDFNYFRGQILNLLNNAPGADDWLEALKGMAGSGRAVGNNRWDDPTSRKWKLDVTTTANVKNLIDYAVREGVNVYKLRRLILRMIKFLAKEATAEAEEDDAKSWKMPAADFGLEDRNFKTITYISDYPVTPNPDTLEPDHAIDLTPSGDYWDQTNGVLGGFFIDNQPDESIILKHGPVGDEGEEYMYITLSLVEVGGVRQTSIRTWNVEVGQGDWSSDGNENFGPGEWDSPGSWQVWNNHLLEGEQFQVHGLTLLIGSTGNVGDSEGVICFLGDTKVKTDQGIVKFNRLTTRNTLYKKKIKKITRVINADDNMIFIKKHALGKRIPNKNTYISRNHGIIIDGKFVRARTLVNGKTIQEHKREKDKLYNILMDEHLVMYVNNMPCETLNPNDPMVKDIIKKM